MNASTITSSLLYCFISDREENVNVTEVQLSATEQDAASVPLPGSNASSSNQSQPGESVWEIEMLVEQQHLPQGPASAARAPFSRSSQQHLMPKLSLRLLRLLKLLRLFRFFRLIRL